MSGLQPSPKLEDSSHKMRIREWLLAQARLRFKALFNVYLSVKRHEGGDDEHGEIKQGL